MQNPPPRTPQPDFFYSSILQTTVKTKTPAKIRPVHARIIKSGLHLGAFLMNTLMNAYAKSSSLSEAQKVFDEMPLRNVSSYNTLLSAYAKQGKTREALSIFNRTPDPDSVSWTALIVGYNRMARFEVSFRLFLEMIRSGVSPTEYTFTNVLASCMEIEGIDLGRKIHSFIVKLSLSGYISVSNSLLNMYAKSGDFRTALTVYKRFWAMTDRDLISWNSMIAGYNQCGLDQEALEMFVELNLSEIRPDRYTLASVLSACANLERLDAGKQVHAFVVKNEPDSPVPVWNSLISMYSKCGRVETAHKIVLKCGTSVLNVIAFTALLDGYVKLGDLGPAREIFDSLSDRDVVAWTAMIVGYAQNGLNENAMDLFRSMVENGPEPNSYTLAIMLSVSSNLASLNHGKQIHASALKLDMALSVSVSNALINMYSRAGNIGCAKKSFNLIKTRKDPISWTSMIVALAQHGFADESLQLFEEMLLLDIKPDHITYIGVLSACTHAGLVERGRYYFDKMRDSHGIEPTLSHCACMIDLFGRAGLLREAQDFIEKMSVEPDVVSWGSLLASCRVYKNAELAKFAAEKILSIEPENSGAYSALANVYSACGEWEEAAKIRKSMRDRRVKKEQGISWLQIKNRVHVFGAEDSVHPERDSVFRKADEIWEDIKRMGFVPDLGCVLHDLDRELKEQILKYHSEKLAIAYGLLSTPKNSTLRIMKNLRVCNDCHSAIKFVSKLVDREIIVRDATRFHHFKEGLCSCGDYW
ncbi:pentatricopeptide repeat-containing family protein [Striga asiatica]|uniref:Pentatricopeptide repeat-containing family protein n=1 Tax=Striga asiatica TaxID=4170 RepID=A0A5A7PR73_STRAF|nr:pentatricopeptide repeat-containing family protein [Striga asiatica]